MGLKPDFDISICINLAGIGKDYPGIPEIPKNKTGSGLDRVCYAIEELRYVDTCELGIFNYVSINLETKCFKTASRRLDQLWAKIVKVLERYNKIGLKNIV